MTLNHVDFHGNTSIVPTDILEQSSQLGSHLRKGSIIARLVFIFAKNKHLRPRDKHTPSPFVTTNAYSTSHVKLLHQISVTSFSKV